MFSALTLFRAVHVPAAALSALLLSTAAFATPADVFRQWTGDPWIDRQVTLGELGFDTPIALQGGDGNSRRELFMPVPKGMSLQNATLQLDADYLRGDGGRSTFVLSIDGYPVSSRRFNDDRGDASLSIGVDSAPRDTGFVRIGAAWSSTVSDVVCADQSAPGNVLRIKPGTRLSYRIDRNQINNLSTAWSTLPQRPVLMVASRNLAQPAYDAAWRIGLALERAGKRARVVTLPALGDTVDMGGTEIPADLRAIPAFAALAADSRMHRIANAAEVGALLALGSHGPLRADIVVADGALIGALNAALDSLRVQMGGADAAAFATWRKDSFSVVSQPPTAGPIALRTLGGAPLIAVSDDAGAQAAQLFDGLWKSVANGSVIRVAAVGKPRIAERILLSDLGGKPGSLEVGNRSDWTATFGIEDVADDGRAPKAVVLDLSATPDNIGAGPVASVYFNDFLLGADILTPDGRPHRLRVAVPDYMLAPRNVVRVSFLRQLSRTQCHDQQTSYPVSVLPTSHVELGKVPSGSNFAGIRRRFADGGQIIVPAAWLADAASSLPRVIGYANAAGVSLSGTKLTVVMSDQVGSGIKPDSTFLAFDLPVEKPLAQVDAAAGRMVLSDGKSVLIDASQLERITVLQVAEVGGQQGVVYQATSAGAPVPRRPILLGRGNVALLDASGVALEIDTRDPRGAQLASEANPETLWERYRPLWIALGIITALLLLAGRIALVRRRQRHQRSNAAGGIAP